jgi:hypothetical protein
MPPPASQPIGINRLIGVPGLTYVVIAWHGEYRHGKLRKELCTKPEIALITGTVHGNVAAV